MATPATSTAPAPDGLPRSPGYLRSKVPPRDATLPGAVGGAVTITWDRWGTPHVRAKRRPDVFFGLGYATAQECLWRLEYYRRLARGTLAEALGRDAVDSDRAMRTIGFGRNAEDLARRLSERLAEALEPFSRGVNRWIELAVAAKMLPVELDWLGIEPAPWTPADSIACWKHRWWTNTGRLDNIAAAEAARRTLPAELLPAFMAAELGEDTIVPAAGPVPPGGDDTGEGSNNWVAAGSRTTTGLPVLCSDPHNAFTQPGQWLIAHLTATDGTLDAAGAVFAGTPGVYMGRNRHVAWGYTNHVASTRDLYREEMDPAHPGMYREGGEWRPISARREVIRVRGEAPEQIVIRSTVRGPLVNFMLPDLGAEEPPISLRWAGLELGPGLDSMLALNRAGSVAEALEAWRAWEGPILNGIVADDQGGGPAGAIAYHVVGRVPNRVDARRGYRSAVDPADAWLGWIDYDALPQLLDPDRGWIATANQPPWKRDPEGIAYVASGAWADGNRMRRIATRLEAKARHTPEELAAIQADVTGQRPLELLPALLELLDSASTPAAEQARAILAGWDARYTPDTPAPALWTAFWAGWLRRVAAARFPGSLARLVAGQAGAVGRGLLLGKDTSPPWFGDRDVRAEVTFCVEDAIAQLAERYGSDPQSWRWGAVHTVTYRHALSQQGPPELRAAAAELFDVGPYPTTGGTGTVRAAGGDGHGFEVTSGSTFRLVADLAAGTLSMTTNTGQSNHPGSPHYADQAPLWLEDRYHPCPLDDGFEVEGVTTITPDTSGAPAPAGPA